MKFTLPKMPDKTKLFVIFLFVVLFISNILFNGMYITFISTAMFVMSFFILGLLTTPMFFIVQLIESALSESKIKQGMITTIAMVVVLPLTYIVEVALIRDFEFDTLPFWLNFEGAFFIVPLIFLLSSIILGRLQHKKSKEEERTSIFLFSYVYILNMFFIGVLYAPYLFELH